MINKKILLIITLFSFFLLTLNGSIYARINMPIELISICNGNALCEQFAKQVMKGLAKQGFKINTDNSARILISIIFTQQIKDNISNAKATPVMVTWSFVTKDDSTYPLGRCLKASLKLIELNTINSIAKNIIENTEEVLNKPLSEIIQ